MQGETDLPHKVVKACKQRVFSEAINETNIGQVNGQHRLFGDTQLMQYFISQHFKKLILYGSSVFHVVLSSHTVGQERLEILLALK
mmetsp:Transcript_6309/g.15216  ORF Transcript_6309/g.15216 Transcript_6309/m.15216 type:complete len:86 (+) Transcript_6309:496-753(+)